MTTIQSIILGAVQGITEFLPVSSSGHLQLAKEFLGVHLTDNIAFDVALHAGTVCSTIVVLWSEIWWLIKGLFSFKLNDSHIYTAKIIVSMVPIAIVGFLFKDDLDVILSSPYVLLVVGAMLLLTAALLQFAAVSKSNGEHGCDIGFGDAFVIGLAQALAVMPGLSRSGSTIATGILLGNDKADVARFSFLMVLVPIIGSTLLDVIKGGGTLVVDGVDSATLMTGFASAFVVGVIACRTMIEIVKRGKLSYFAIYCAVAGVLAIAEYIYDFV